MKKILLILGIILTLGLVNTVCADEILSIEDLNNLGIIANSPITKKQLEQAQKIIIKVHKKTAENIKNGSGPFYAEIYDEKGNLVAATSNSVVKDKCALYHAEINAIKKASEKYKNYDLSPKNLTIYINAEPCQMCAGAIMWSGINTVYFSVPSKDVETITGFDEGYKPDWIEAFKKRGITVYGNIEPEKGKNVLKKYVIDGNKIYKPTRKQND